MITITAFFACKLRRSRFWCVLTSAAISFFETRNIHLISESLSHVELPAIYYFQDFGPSKSASKSNYQRFLPGL